MKQLTIAIDFDDTFTALPNLFSHMAKLAAAEGHKVIIVTARRDTYENNDDIEKFLEEYKCTWIPVYFTGLRSKIDYMKDRGVEVNVWCDDNPLALVNGH